MRSAKSYFINPALMFFTAVLVFAGCENEWPYEPEIFKVPTLKPGLNFFAHKDSVQGFMSTGDIKIVYLEGTGRNRSLYYLDYSAADSFVDPQKLHMPVELDASFIYPAEAPIISPDGKWVAYFITDKVTTSISFVQRLDTAALPVVFEENAAHPHWWTDSLDKQYILYCDAASGDIELDSGYTKLQQVDPANPAAKIGAAVTIAPDSYNGGISANGRYLFTGDYRSYLYDRQTGTAIPINDGIQTCNASMSPDTGSDFRMMFLNIGGPQNLANNQNSYEQHQIVFIVGADNTADYVLDKNEVFDDAAEWQDPEWSNHPDYFIALSQQGDDYDLYIVRIGTPVSVLQINNDKLLRMPHDASPYLWIERP